MPLHPSAVLLDFAYLLHEVSIIGICHLSQDEQLLSEMHKQYLELVWAWGQELGEVHQSLTQGLLGECSKYGCKILYTKLCSPGSGHCWSNPGYCLVIFWSKITSKLVQCILLQRWYAYQWMWNFCMRKQTFLDLCEELGLFLQYHSTMTTCISIEDCCCTLEIGNPALLLFTCILVLASQLLRGMIKEVFDTILKNIYSQALAPWLCQK